MVHSQMYDAMVLFGKALLDYYSGKTKGEILLERDDGFAQPLPMSVFFRTEDQLTPLENRALNQCHGRILDVGAGAGIHSIVLEKRGMDITALDISPGAVSVIQANGVSVVRSGNILELAPESFDTLLLMGHGIGMVQDLKGLHIFLQKMHEWVTPDGQLLIHSLDVTCTEDPVHLKYHELLRSKEKYIGEIRLRIHYQDEVGSWYGWLQVDGGTLSEIARQNGWHTEILIQEPDGNLLARLTQSKS